MDQIRFDFLNSVNGTSRNSNATANANTAESSDAFSQILDQQLTRKNDAAQYQRPASDPRSRSDASDRSDAIRPQVLKRRDTKSTSSTTPAKPDTATAKPAPKPQQPAKAADSTGTDKPSAKPDQDETDKTTEAAAGGQTTTESSTCSGKTETEGKPDTNGDSTQQQGDGKPDQPQDGTDTAQTVATDADLNLLAALATPLPLQTISVTTDATADALTPAGTDAATAALQAGLAANLAAAVDLTAATGAGTKAQAPATGGLKFGAILGDANGQPQKPTTDPLTTLDDASQALTKGADPLATSQPDANGAKLNDAGRATPARTRDTSSASASTVNPELNGKSPATIVQPVGRSAGVTWSGTTMRNELSESLAVSAGTTLAADDAEFSNWSQYLGSGAGGATNGLSARQAAFMNQLKQNLQFLPPHEQIAVQIQNAMQNGNSRLTVALHPAELGRVEVKLDIDKDKNVTATVVVDRPATLVLLQRDAKALERALQDAGLQTGSGSLSFNLRDSNGQNGNAAQNGTGTGGGSGSGTGTGPDAKAETVRPDVVATADGYVDLET